MTRTYEQFLASKLHLAEPVGIEALALSDALFPFQRDIARLALHRGRCAVFCQTGLGKSFLALEWLREVHEYAKKPVLLLAPLAVSHQFEREAKKFGIEVHLVKDASEVVNGINITNYQKLHRFDPSIFSGVALDESGILKSMEGSTRNLLIHAFKDTPFRIALTATPAPNDHEELGNHAAFLGIMSYTEMRSMYFVQDGDTTQKWRLKGHAEEAFWRFVASWAVTVRTPSDLGYDDGDYLLPPLSYHHHIVDASQEEVFASGVLFAEGAKTLTDQRNVRRSTIESRVKLCTEIVRNNPCKSHWLVWCGLNAEHDALEDAFKTMLGHAQTHSVRGGMDEDDQVIEIEEWTANGGVMVSKASVMGFGLNLQFCSDAIYCGVSHSWESWYQSVRRIYRFGQKNPVNCHIVSSEFDSEVIRNLERKESDAMRMGENMVKAMATIAKEELRGTRRAYVPYISNKIDIPSWLGEGVLT